MHYTASAVWYLIPCIESVCDVTHRQPAQNGGSHFRRCGPQGQRSEYDLRVLTPEKADALGIRRTTVGLSPRQSGAPALHITARCPTTTRDQNARWNFITGRNLNQKTGNSHGQNNSPGWPTDRPDLTGKHRRASFHAWSAYRSNPRLIRYPSRQRT